MEESSAVMQVPIFWLQDTERRRRALNQRRDQRTGQNRDERIVEHHQDILELRQISKRLDCAAHQRHTGHQDGKADADRADVLFLAALCKHNQNDADQRDDGRKTFRL